MTKADEIAYEHAKACGTLGLDYIQIYDAVKYGYIQAQDLFVKEINRLRDKVNSYDASDYAPYEFDFDGGYITALDELEAFIKNQYN